MSLIRLVLDKFSFGKICAALIAVSSSLSFAEGVVDSVARTSHDTTTAKAPLDAPAVEAPVSAETLLASFDSSGTASAVDNLTTEADKKTVLYLGGGENSPWFYLGVLYAIEEYQIPVDSVVGTSWGAWVGAMWAKGMRLDDMQRMFLEKDFEPFVGRDIIAQKTQLDPFELPISVDGLPSLRYRFVFKQDSLGIPRQEMRAIVPDTAGLERSLAYLRFQESLYRQSIKYKIPFAVLGCEGLAGNENEDVIKSLPLPGHSQSGEVCPYFALPAEDVIGEFPIIVIADPVRNDAAGTPWQRALKKQASLGLSNQPGVVVRAHSISDSSHKALIQAGFSAMENRVNKLGFLQKRKKSYENTKREVYPWFRYNPTFDSLSAEKHASAKSFWNESDTGVVAPRNFAYAIAQHPVYDSLEFSMQPNGDLVVGAKSAPVFDVAVGGFGSNALGPNVYGELGVRFIDQMEFNISLNGFWGYAGYGLRPYFSIDKLWRKNWSVTFLYEWAELHPLDSYVDDLPREDRVYSENRNDLLVSVDYALGDKHKVGLDFVFGNREFEIDSVAYGEKFFNTYPVSPNLHYELSSGKNDKWFSTEGYSVAANLGLQSIGFDMARVDLIPIYWKGSLDLRYTVSPKEVLTFTFGASGGVEKYQGDDGDYVYPKEFDYAVLSNCFRFHPEATPWGSEWYDATLASHQYGLLRMSGALHYKGNGLWLFGAFVHDFEENPSVDMDVNKIVVEPALRLSYKSLSLYIGMTQTVGFDMKGDLTDFGNYKYFVRIGDYKF